MSDLTHSEGVSGFHQAFEKGHGGQMLAGATCHVEVPEGEKENRVSQVLCEKANAKQMQSKCVAAACQPAHRLTTHHSPGRGLGLTQDGAAS